MKLVPTAAGTTRATAWAGQMLMCWGLRGFARCALSWGLVADARAAEASASFDDELGVAGGAALVALLYELLDAHADTTHLAGELERDPRWEAHLDYLRVLQRKGRETLAHGLGETLPSSWPPVRESMKSERPRRER